MADEVKDDGGKLVSWDKGYRDVILDKVDSLLVHQYL
jgi:hypothetical protein